MCLLWKVFFVDRGDEGNWCLFGWDGLAESIDSDMVLLLDVLVWLCQCECVVLFEGDRVLSGDEGVRWYLSKWRRLDVFLNDVSYLWSWRW